MRIHESRPAKVFRLLCQALIWVYVAFGSRVFYRLANNGCIAKTVEAATISIATYMMLMWSFTWEPNRKLVSLINALIQCDQKYFRKKFIRSVR